MASIPVFLFLGNSNMDGYATLNDVPAADITRWSGAALSVTYPQELPIEGVKMWTEKMPSSGATSYTSTASAAATITLDGFTYSATDHLNAWVYVRLAATGQGQHRKIIATGSAGTTIGVGPDWSPVPTAVGSTVELINESHTTSAAIPTLLTKSTNPPDWTVNEHVGKWVMLISSALAGTARRIESNTATTVTPEVAFPDTIAASGTGFVILENANTVDGISTLLSTNGSLRDLTFYHDYAYWSKTGYDYPNFTSLPWIAPVAHLALQRFNCVPELTWQLRQDFTTDIYGLHLGVGGSSMAPNNVWNTYSTTAQSWAIDVVYQDWHPSSTDGLFQVLTTKLTNMKAAIVAEGNTMDVRGVFAVMGEIDAFNEDKAGKALSNMTLIRDTLRDYLVANSMTTLSAGKVPWVMSNVGSDSWPYADTVNAAFQQIVDDDPYSGLVDTSDLTYEGDGIHFDAPGAIELGKRFYSKWKAIQTLDSDAMVPADERFTLAALKTRVRRRYERNGSGNEDSATQLATFINDSIREIILTLGDNAWWMRRSAVLELASGVYPGTVNLPRNVARLLRIESQAYPGKSLPWKGITYTDQGRMQVTLHTAGPAPYVGHWIIPFKELEQDTDVAQVPPQHVELVVLLACKRLAEASGNATIAAYYAGESARLWQAVKRDALRYDRFRQEGLTPSDTYDHWRDGGSSDPLWGL